MMDVVGHIAVFVFLVVLAIRIDEILRGVRDLLKAKISWHWRRS